MSIDTLIGIIVLAVVLYLIVCMDKYVQDANNPAMQKARKEMGEEGEE